MITTTTHLCEHCKRLPTGAGRRYCGNTCRIAALVAFNKEKRIGRTPMRPEDRKVGLSIHLTPAQAEAACVAGGGKHKPPYDHRSIKRGVYRLLEELSRKK